MLNFKELSWHTVRIEAKSTKNEDLTPLRLITNQARCRFGDSTPPMLLWFYEKIFLISTKDRILLYATCVDVRNYRDCSSHVPAHSAENVQQLVMK